LLGAATGLSFAAVAGLLKEEMGALNRGMGALVTAWPFYALVGVGALGLLINQLAYQAGPLSSSLPAIMTVDPIVSLVIGVAVFDEHFRNGPAALLGEAVGLALVVIAAGGLTRSGPTPASGPGANPHLSESRRFKHAQTTQIGADPAAFPGRDHDADDRPRCVGQGY
jgi:hypothetical protein